MLRIGSRRMKSGLEKLLSSADSTQKEKLCYFTISEMLKNLFIGRNQTQTCIVDEKA